MVKANNIRNQRAQGTGHRAQGTGHRAQGTGHRAQSTGHGERTMENGAWSKESQKPEASGRLIIVSAPSGAGKTTIVRHLLSKPCNLGFSVSATSRSPRENEKEGVDYYFLSLEEFKEKINEKAFLEWEEVYPGIFYGTLKSEIDRILSEGKNVIFDVDVKGGLNIKKIYGERALSVFVAPPSVDTLSHRLRLRSTETEEKIVARIAKATYEMSFAGQFDVILVNDRLDVALKEAEDIVKEFLAQGTGHRAQGTGHGARGTGHGAQGTGHGAQGTEQ